MMWGAPKLTTKERLTMPGAAKLTMPGAAKLMPSNDKHILVSNPGKNSTYSSIDDRGASCLKEVQGGSLFICKVKCSVVIWPSCVCKHRQRRSSRRVQESLPPHKTRDALSGLISRSLNDSSIVNSFGLSDSSIDEKGKVFLPLRVLDEFYVIVFVGECCLFVRWHLYCYGKEKRHDETRQQLLRPHKLKRFKRSES